MLINNIAEEAKRNSDHIIFNTGASEDVPINHNAEETITMLKVENNGPFSSDGQMSTVCEQGTSAVHSCSFCSKSVHIISGISLGEKVIECMFYAMFVKMNKLMKENKLIDMLKELQRNWLKLLPKEPLYYHLEYLYF